VAIGVAAVVFDRTTVFPGSAAALPVAGSALLLAAGVRTQAGASRLLGSPAMTYIGKISYGWYLWHWPCLVLARIAWGSPTVDPGVESSTAPRPLVAVAAVLVSFGLAALTYRYVEQPTRTSRVLSASRPLTVALAAALLVTLSLQIFLPDALPNGLRPAPRIQTVEVKTPGAPLTASAQYVALLQGQAGGPAFILTVDGATKNFTVRKVGATPEPGKSFELWLISDKLPRPRSLGVIGGGDFTVRPVLSSYDADVINAATYAVTVEPAGGSPSGQPTSAPVFSGKLIETVPPSQPQAPAKK
jgi:hypothetical protein